MHFNIKNVKTENQLNKAIKKQKKDGGRVAILFYSEWDTHGLELVSKLKSLNTKSGGTPLHLVSSFATPHSFVIYKTSKTPHLVTLGGNGYNSITSEDYLPTIYKSLGVP